LANVLWAESFLGQFHNQTGFSKLPHVENWPDSASAQFAFM